MKRGGLLIVAAALLLGGVGGYAAAREFPSSPTAVTIQNPVPAEDPAVPQSDAGIVPDPNLDPLSPNLDMAEVPLSTGERAVSVLVPSGWDRHDLRPGEARWTLPDRPPGTHSVRVRIPPDGWKLSRMVNDRREALTGDPTISDLDLDPDDSSAVITGRFVRNGYRKIMVIRWINFSGARVADLEIAWTGRYRDERGMRGLLTRMAMSARAVPTAESSAGEESPG